MYHRIQHGSSGRHPYFETSTDPVVFARHVQYLRAAGFKGVTLAQAADYLESGFDKAKLVAITFDDGYRDFYYRAIPILVENGFTATIFVVSGLASIAGAGDRSRGEFMTSSEIRQVHSLGFEVGSHTVTHPVLWKLSHAELWNEISQSKHEIENILGSTVQSFCHPFAFPEHDQAYVSVYRTLLYEAGYRQGTCTALGTAKATDCKYYLPRLPINTHDDMALFAAKLDGGYDWLHVSQLFYKRWIKPPTAMSFGNNPKVGRL